MLIYIKFTEVGKREVLKFPDEAEVFVPVLGLTAGAGISVFGVGVIGLEAAVAVGFAMPEAVPPADGIPVDLRDGQVLYLQ